MEFRKGQKEEMGVLFLSTQLQNMVNSVYIVLSKDKDKKTPFKKSLHGHLFMFIIII